MMTVAGPASRDERLVEQVLAGDRNAFSTLLRAHDAKARSLAAKLLGGDQHRMDDALQEAYVKAYRSLAQFRGDAAFGTWLHRIVHNACMDELRRGANWAEPVDVTATEPAATGATGPERAVTTADTVGRALEMLTLDQRAAVVLVDGQGFDVPTAAEILGVAPGTVGSRLSRARALLRNQLREEDS